MSASIHGAKASSTVASGWFNCTPSEKKVVAAALAILCLTAAGTIGTLTGIKIISPWQWGLTSIVPLIGFTAFVAYLYRGPKETPPPKPLPPASPETDKRLSTQQHGMLINKLPDAVVTNCLFGFLNLEQLAKCRGVYYRWQELGRAEIKTKVQRMTSMTLCEFRLSCRVYGYRDNLTYLASRYPNLTSLDLRSHQEENGNIKGLPFLQTIPKKLAVRITTVQLRRFTTVLDPILPRLAEMQVEEILEPQGSIYKHLRDVVMIGLPWFAIVPAVVDSFAVRNINVHLSSYLDFTCLDLALHPLSPTHPFPYLENFPKYCTRTREIKLHFLAVLKINPQLKLLMRLSPEVRSQVFSVELFFSRDASSYAEWCLKEISKALPHLTQVHFSYTSEPSGQSLFQRQKPLLNHLFPDATLYDRPNPDANALPPNYRPAPACNCFN